jgi:DNA-binding MarR family transcriptional regulator/ribosomal protein S18 acetylase RimI-like enzyme
MNESQIQRVRRFNRTVTRRIGVLTDDYLGHGRPLAESRLLFEAGHAGADVRDLRARLGLDSGYASRLLRALEAQGLVRVQASPVDARRRHVVLTAKGRREVDALDRDSRALADSLLAPLSARQRERLVDAMDEVERLMRASAAEVALEDPASVEAQACIQAYLDELDARFEGGFDAARSVSADPGELVPPRGAFVVARLEGEAVACGGLKRIADGMGEIKRMWVAPDARGLGIAQRVLDALEAHAVAMGLRTLRLDTNGNLVEARALYDRNGYIEIPAYNDNPYAHHWFEKSLRTD